MLNFDQQKNLIDSVKNLLKNHSGGGIQHITSISDEDVLGFNDPKPLITEPSQINDSQVLFKLKRILRELIFSDNQEQAFHLTLFLEEILYKTYIALKTDNPKIFGEYERILNIARFICITTLNLDEILTLISHYLVEAVKSDIEVRDKLDEALRHYNDFIKEGEISRLFYESLIKNREIIGKRHLVDNDNLKDPLPTIQNWTSDYLTFSRKATNEKRSIFHRINYLNKSPNVSGLNKYEKEILGEILEILDWLEFGENDYFDNMTSNRVSKSDRRFIIQDLYKVWKDLAVVFIPLSLGLSLIAFSISSFIIIAS
jgi:hypothetical protein